MRNKKIFAVIATSLLLVIAPTIQVRAESRNFVLDSTTNTLSESFTTSDTITRVEVYYSSAYPIDNSTMKFTQGSSGANFIITGATIDTSGSVTEGTEMDYGGACSVPNYDLNCSIYYIVSNGADTWNVTLDYSNALKECFIVKSTVPSDWNTSTDSFITKPQEFCIGFINSKSSQYTSADITSIINSGVQEVTTGGTFATAQPDEAKDPIKGILMIAIVGVFISIIVTYMKMRKEEQKRREHKRNEFVKKANKKVSSKKKAENNELKEMMDDFSSEYEDDWSDDYQAGEEEEKPEVISKPSEPQDSFMKAQIDAALGIAPQISPMPQVSPAQAQPDLGYVQNQAMGYGTQQPYGYGYPAQPIQPQQPKKIPAFARKDDEE